MKHPSPDLLEAMARDPFDPKDLASEDLRAKVEHAVHELRVCVQALQVPTEWTTPRVRTMAARAWTILVSKAVPVRVMSPTSERGIAGIPDSPVFAVASEEDGAHVGQVFVPIHWPEVVKENRIRETGIVVYVLAYLVAFVDGRETGAAVPAIAAAYHAEYLRTILALNPGYPLNAYQKGHLERFPQGLDSPGAVELAGDAQPTVTA